MFGYRSHSNCILKRIDKICAHILSSIFSYFVYVSRKRIISINIWNFSGRSGEESVRLGPGLQGTTPTLSHTTSFRPVVLLLSLPLKSQILDKRNFHEMLSQRWEIGRKCTENLFDNETCAKITQKIEQDRGRLTHFCQWANNRKQ